MIIPVVMYVDHSIKLGILSNMQFCFTLDTFGQSLSGIFLHLDVKEFPVSKQTKKSVMRSFGKQIDKKNSVAPSCQRMSFAFIETVAIPTSRLFELFDKAISGLIRFWRL